MQRAQGKTQVSFPLSPPGLIPDGCQMTRSGDHAVLGETPGTERRSMGDSSVGRLREQTRRRPRLSWRGKGIVRRPNCECFIETNKRPNAKTSLFGSCRTFRVSSRWHDKSKHEIGKRTQSLPEWVFLASTWSLRVEGELFPHKPLSGFYIKQQYNILASIQLQ